MRFHLGISKVLSNACSCGSLGTPSVSYIPRTCLGNGKNNVELAEAQWITESCMKLDPVAVVVLLLWSSLT